ncbi:hypothetical protein ACFC09_15660 [Streptomyces sp. NPDC056161]|uniref:hypothetical protein n=1 Tax=Streptomyces sp. NPDC056161 TaxID=3345732 RepID=UPI0035E39D85
MAQFGCGGSRCTCQVTGGPGVTVTGNGSHGAPYVIEADGGTVSCDQVRPCISAADGAAYDPATGVVSARPSADAGNQLSMGTDGRLLVPPLEAGCGLRGDGTTGSPLAAYAIGGSDAWTDRWGCDAPTHSTLKCDPDTGALWTPPEHYTAADHLYQEHMDPSIASIGPTGGWVVLQPGGTAAVFQFNVPANFLGNDCRLWTYDAQVHGAFDINWSSTATFEVGYIITKDGGPAMVRPLLSLLTATGSARRERHTGSVSEALFNIPAGNAAQVLFFPAVNVTAGTIGINSWTSDGTIRTTTQA